MSEPEIIQKTKKGNVLAQRALYESYAPYAVGILKRFGIPQHEWPDIMQEIFVQVFISIKKYNPTLGAFKAWFKKIALNTIIKWVRTKKNDTKPITLNGNTHVKAESAEAMQKIDEQHLLEMINELPKGYNVVFNLFAIDGYSHKEISEKLGIEESSSRARLSRARKILQQKLSAQSKQTWYGSF